MRELQPPKLFEVRLQLLDHSKTTASHRTVAMAHLTNLLATPEQLYRRTQFSALPQDLQDIIFYQTQCLTQAAGLLLQLPQSVTAQANVLLARFWLIEPMLSHEFSVSPHPFLTPQIPPVY